MANSSVQRASTCYGVSVPGGESVRFARACVLASNAPGSQVGASYWDSCAAMSDNGCAAYECPAYPPGTRANGAPCLASLQCGSSWCKGTSVAGSGNTTLQDALQCGTCASRLPQGSPCDVVADACAIGLSCFQGKCRPLGQRGDACATWGDCAAPDYVCKSSGTCDTITPDGQACQTGADCTTDTGCDATTKVCTPTHYGSPGEFCDGDVHRCAAGACNAAAGVCPRVLADGASCDPTSVSTVCDVYARCFTGKCQIPEATACH